MPGPESKRRAGTLEDDNRSVELVRGYLKRAGYQFINSKEKVAFVPGKTFYPDLDVIDTMRLNFSNSDEEKINVGIERLGRAIRKFI